MTLGEDQQYLWDFTDPLWLIAKALDENMFPTILHIHRLQMLLLIAFLSNLSLSSTKYLQHSREKKIQCRC